jgi:hypothetical protein
MGTGRVLREQPENACPGKALTFRVRTAQPVAHSGLGTDVNRAAAIGLDLLAQSAYVGAQRLGVALKRLPPNVGDDLVGREDPATMPG